MSQFMMCFSYENLTGFEFSNLTKNISNKELFIKVADKNLKHKENKNIWVMEKIDDYFSEAQLFLNNGKSFKSTKLYNILFNICDLCEVIIFWYGSEFENLDMVIDKKQMLLKIEESVKDSMCECYLIFKNKSKFNGFNINRENMVKHIK